MQLVRIKKIYTLPYLVLSALLLLLGCDKSTISKTERINVLNSLISHYQSFEDSIAIFHESYKYETSEINFANYKNNYYFGEAFTISQKDMETWQKQLPKVKTVNWKDWGWKAHPFITEKEYPKSFDYSGPPPPGVKIETSLTVYFFSMPLISKNHAFVKVASKSGKYNWSVDIVLLEKINRTWQVKAKRNIVTS